MSLTSFFSLFKRDISSELRGPHLLVVSLLLCLLLSTLIGGGLALTSIRPEEVERLSSVLIWLTFFVVATIVLDRSMDRDIELGALDSLRTSGFSLSALYLSRVASTLLLTSVILLFSLFLLSLVVGIQVPSLASFLAVSFLSLLSYSFLSTLIAPLTARAQFKGTLFSLALFPLLFPLFFSSVDLTHKILRNGSIPWETPSLSLLFAIAVIYGALGINLYSYALEE